ncbi:hypothetical protein D3C87_1448510 [compost metagenome]
MTGNEDLLPVFGCHEIDPGVLRFCQNLEIFLCFNIRSAHGGMTGMRHIEHFIKSAQKLNIRNINGVWEHPEAFLRQSNLRHTKVVVQSCLRGPTYMKS